MERLIGCFVALLVGLSFGILAVSLLINFTPLSNEIGYVLLFITTAIIGFLGFVKPKWFLWVTDLLPF